MSFNLTNFANNLLRGPIRDTGEKVSIPAPVDAPEPDEDDTDDDDEPDDPRDVAEFYQCWGEGWREYK